MCIPTRRVSLTIYTGPRMLREFIDLSLKEIRLATVSSGYISLKSAARAVYSIFLFLSR